MKTCPEAYARPGQPGPDSAFTFIELLVVIGTLAVLVLVVAPAFAASKPNGKVAQCLNNQRQLAVAWQMYASDNADLLVSPTSWISSGAILDWTSNPANTNAAYLTNSADGLSGSYVKTAAIYKCPADFYQSTANPGPRIRSVSLDGALGGTGPTAQGSAPGGGQYFGTGPFSAGHCTKLSYLAKPGPASVFLFADEHPDSINDNQFMNDPGYAATGEKWRDLPASYHNNGAGFSFADGHTEMHIWQNQNNATCFPVLFLNYTTGAPWSLSLYRNDLDYQWLEGHMPYR
jgi:prepilin-type processing-associated H-X9-DG protein